MKLAPMLSKTKRDGLDPAIFGPRIWSVMHILCHHIRDPNLLQALTRALTSTLMCVYCRVSTKAFLTVVPFPIYNSNRNLWIVFWNNLHNWVNDKLRKRLWSTLESTEKYGTKFTDWKSFEHDTWALLLDLLKQAPKSHGKGTFTSPWTREHELNARYRNTAEVLLIAVASLPTCNTSRKYLLKKAKESDFLLKFDLKPGMAITDYRLDQ
jgi:hypothetical protein